MFLLTFLSYQEFQRKWLGADRRSRSDFWESSQSKKARDIWSQECSIEIRMDKGIGWILLPDALSMQKGTEYRISDTFWKAFHTVRVWRCGNKKTSFFFIWEWVIHSITTRVSQNSYSKIVWKNPLAVRYWFHNAVFGMNTAWYLYTSMCWYQAFFEVIWSGIKIFGWEVSLR